ncbi:MAG: polymer-forming cytoskeletal protein [Clostridiales bacterium]|nr:polymer-forming cytoskeletal protein [Clostridiales bacterium]
MGFFKDLKQDSNKANDEAANIDTSEEVKESKNDAENDLDEDMYKDILAAAEEILTEDEEKSTDEENSTLEKASLQNDSSKGESSQKTETSQKEAKNEKSLDKQNKGKSEKEEKVENTMVDYDENAVDSEILDTLLKDEDNAEKTEKVETAKPQSPAKELTAEDKEAVTVITKGTTINGSITSDCSLDIMGTINGDIDCAGKLSITGKVVGNSMANEVYVNTDRLQGSISSEGSVKIAEGTVVIGDITATSGVFAGAVKGEIDVTGPVVIDSTAVIKGNVKAKSVQMNNGAVLEGFCSLTYSDVVIDDIFE